MLRSLFVSVIIFSLIPLIFFRPHLGVLVWSWVSYMNPHRLTYGFAYHFTFLIYAGAATIIAAFLSREPKRIPNHPLIWLIGIYFLWTTLTTFTAVEQDMAWIKWERVAKQLLFTFFTIMFMMSFRRLHALLWVIILSLGFFAMKGGLFTVLTAGANRVWGPMGTFFADNNHFALAMCMILPLVRYLQVHTTVKYLRWFLGAMLFLGFFSILGTHSRGGLLGIMAMVSFLVIKSRYVVFSIVAVAAVAMIAFMFMPESWHRRMATIENYEQDASATQRLDMWRYAIDVANHHPIVGGGYDVFYSDEYHAMFLPAGVEGRAAHSIWFEVLGEHGYIGLVLFILLGVSTYFTCSTIIRRCKPHPEVTWARDFAAMLQVGLVGFASAGTFLNVATFDLYYHMIAMAVMVRVLADRAISEKTASQEADKEIAVAGNGLKPAIAPPLARR